MNKAIHLRGVFSSGAHASPPSGSALRPSHLLRLLCWFVFPFITCILFVPRRPRGLGFPRNDCWDESYGKRVWLGTVLYCPSPPPPPPSICRERSTVACRSINIKSSRKHNLLTHWFPSGLQRLAGAERNNTHEHRCEASENWLHFHPFQLIYIPLSRGGKDQWHEKNNGRNRNVPFPGRAWKTDHYLFAWCQVAAMLRRKALFVLKGYIPWPQSERLYILRLRAKRKLHPVWCLRCLSECP